MIDPAAQTTRDRVFFGASVSYVDEDDLTHEITIVGCDEADLTRREISLVSPVARALMRSRVGDESVCKRRAGR